MFDAIDCFRDLLLLIDDHPANLLALWAMLKVAFVCESPPRGHRVWPWPGNLTQCARKLANDSSGLNGLYSCKEFSHN